MNQPLTQEEWLTYLDTTWKECLNKAWDKDMTQENIIAMAREAELHCHVKLTENGLFIEDLKHFAALVIEHYKDECGHELNEAIKEMQERGFGQ